MRLFTGLDLPEDVVGSLDELVQRLKPSAPIAWSPASNLHVTTKFIGELKEERLVELIAALAGVPERDPIPVAVGGIAYLLGAIPFGYLLVRLKTGDDVRSQGSGNIGATNVMRTSGRAAGIATLLLDIAKGYFAVWVAGRLTGHDTVWMSAA